MGRQEGALIMADETIDDEIASMFDEVTVSGRDGKPLADEKAAQKEAARQLELGVADLKRAWREFKFLDPLRYMDADWWDSLQYLALADDRLKQAFCGSDRSPASLRHYHRWRLHVVDGRPYKLNS
jgi:hypothetical protein